MKGILFFTCLISFSLTAQEVETESNDRFSEANVATSSGPFVGTTDADWQGDMWRLNLAPGTYPVTWTGDACTRFRIVEYITDPAITQPSSTPGAVSTCPQILTTDECHLVDNLPGLGSVSTTFTVVSGRFYFCFINPHNCTNQPYGPALPVELVSFEKECDDEVLKLKWVTASEKDNDYFEIQFSEDGEEFTSIAMESGAGTTTLTQEYEVLVSREFKTGYFRLKQVDFDGNYEYSKTIYTSCSMELTTVTFSNEFLIIESSEEITNINVCDVSGTLIYSGSENRIPSQKLSNGMYIVRLTTPSGEEIHKIIK